MEDNGMVTGVIQTCSVNEARYMLENLLAMAINKSAVTVQSQSKVRQRREDQLMVSSNLWLRRKSWMNLRETTRSQRRLR